MMGRLRIGWVVLATCMLTLPLLPLQLAFISLKLPARNRLPRLWHRAMLKIIGIRIHVHGELERRTPLLLVSNHVSWKDVMVLGAATDVTFVAKAEVRGWPLFGTLARLQRTIFVEREQRRKSADQADDMARRMGAGETVVLFPEGTTSDGNRVLDIKSSLFGAAISAISHSPNGLVHVQPVALAYTRIHGLPMGHYHRPIAAWPGDVALLPHLSAILREGALDVDICFGETIIVSSTTNRKQLSQQAELQIRTMLANRLRGRSA